MPKIKVKTDELAKMLQQIGATVYQQVSQQQAQQQQQTPPPGPEKQPDKVVDADYKVVDEEKKP